ncbi:MAG: tetratricopeptide repeat protein, partial [Candidatus Nitrotoga sp.]
MKQLLFCIFTALLLNVGTTRADPFKDGLASYKRGDYINAVMWYHKAAAQGHAGAKYNLGLMYYSGQGVSQNYSKAVKWYRLAAAQGNTDAQYNLGYLYEKGIGVSQDYTEAMKWYRLAAAQG